VRDGVLYVGGLPVEQTEFARDMRSPVRTLRLPMYDAETDDDLRDLIDRHPDAAFAGSGGLGRAWTASLPRGTFVPPALPSPEHPLVVCGSRHPASRQQAEAARRNGIPILTSSDEPGDPGREGAALAKRASQYKADLLILFGGDTSWAVLRRLGIAELWPVRELMPGIALSTGGGMMIVTKAGGFGARDIVAEILGKLK
jgi:uncharacterized protein YgbK (DUF1537 family)